MEIDGEEQTLDAEDSLVYTFTEPGDHAIVVTYDNGWHSVGFNSFFGKRQWTTAEEAAVVIEDAGLISTTTYLFHVDIYESSDLYNEVVGTVDDSINGSP